MCGCSSAKLSLSSGSASMSNSHTWAASGGGGSMVPLVMTHLRTAHVVNVCMLTKTHPDGQLSVNGAYVPLNEQLGWAG